jgi:hypothetical protein
MDEDKPAAPPDGSLEGEVLNGEWRLGRLLARGDGGDVFAAKSELTGQRVTVWVLAPHLAQDPEIDRRVREAILKNPSVRYLETGEVRALGVTYVVLEDAVVLLPGGLDLAGAMREMLAAPQPTTESAPATPAPRMAAAGRDGSSEMLLVWLQDRRVAAASAGVAPFSPASMRRSAAPFASPAASPQAWAPSAATHRRSDRPGAADLIRRSGAARRRSAWCCSARQWSCRRARPDPRPVLSRLRGQKKTRRSPRMRRRARSTRCRRWSGVGRHETAAASERYA